MPLMTDDEVRERLAELEDLYYQQTRKARTPEYLMYNIRTFSDAQLEALYNKFKDWEASWLAGKPVKAATCEAWERILGQLRDRPLPPYTGPDHWLGERIDPPEEWKEGMPLGIWWGR